MVPTPAHPRRLRRGVGLAAAIALAAALVPLALPSSEAAAANLGLDYDWRRTYAKFNDQGAVDQAHSSPGIGDVTGDGVPDVVVGGMDGMLTVLSATGAQVLRQVLVDGGGMIQASPTLVDLTGDGVLDVLTATVNISGQSFVRAYDMTGSPRRIFDRANITGTPINGFFASPVAGDIDGDGALEVVAIGFDHRLHAWELSGAAVAGFPVYTYDTAFSTPALADIDSDGLLEIVVGGDMDAVGQPLPPGGYLWAVNGNGSVVPGYPLHLSAEVLWSSPALGDVDGDGDMDAVIGTGRNFHNGDGNKLYAVDLNRRVALPGFPRTLGGNTMASPALVQLDGDRPLEIVTTTGTGWVYALEHDGSQKWRSCGMNFSPCGNDYAIIASPAAADIDNDGVVEVLHSGERELVVFDGSNGSREASRPTLSASNSSYAHPGAATPSVGVVGGVAIVAVHVTLENVGDLARGPGDQQAVFVFGTSSAPGAMPWPSFHKGPTRMGSVGGSVRAVNLDAYVDAVYRDLLGRPADAGGRNHWKSQLSGGMTRGEFTTAMARSAEWTSVVVNDLYQDVFGRPADSAGRTYWSGRLQRGSRVAEVASLLYGSAEYFSGSGGTNGSYVDALYQNLLGRTPDPHGKSYWVGELNKGTPRERLASGLFLSIESNAKRVDALYRKLLDRASEAGGRAYWARQLVHVDDIVLAGLLTASAEYFSNNSR